MGTTATDVVGLWFFADDSNSMNSILVLFLLRPVYTCDFCGDFLKNIMNFVFLF